LMITGRVNAGAVTLDGSFELDANPSIEDSNGRFVLEGFDSSGTMVFSHRFSPFTVSDARPDDEAFVVGVPVDARTRSVLARVEVREMGGRARSHTRVRASGPALESSITATRLAGGLRLTRPTGSTRMILVRNPDTREVIGVSRQGSLDLSDFGNTPEVELLVSDGVSSIRQRVNVATGAIIR